MADISKIKLPSDTIYDVKDTIARNGLNGKQDTLVSGTNIKTINNQSLLGSGDISITSTNWLNGSQIGSVRTSGSTEEDSEYTIGEYAVAEGNGTSASGVSSHAGGFMTSATAYCTFAHGTGVSATYPSQTVIGTYNENVDNAFIIGNGTGDWNSVTHDYDCSNALTVDWDGNLDIAGNLQIGDSACVHKVVDLDSTVAPSSDKWKTAIHIKDKNYLSLGYLEGAILSNGNNGLTLTARRDVSGTNKYNGVRLLIDSSGNPVTDFNSPAAWRQGLGLSLSSVQSVASYITSSKGTFVSGQIVTYDRIAQLIIRFRNTSTVGTGGNVYEGKLTKWYPVSLNGSGVNGVGYFGANALVGYINSGGDIIVRNASTNSITISSSSNAYVTFTYLMGANQ